MSATHQSQGDPSCPTLYVVATVHLDTQWRWTVQDTIRDFLPATLKRNFDLLERYPFFVVSFEGAFRYQLMKEYYERDFAKLRQWVKAGRWGLAGSMLDAPDVNMVAPESLIRHILYGNRFFEREFGQRSRDIFLPDCFGYGWALPAVAAHCGLIGFSGQKFGRWMAPATIPFDVGVWQGPDGGEVIAAIRPEGYGEGLGEDLSRAPRFRERLQETGRQSGAHVGIKYVGVGDRGGGLDEDSMQWLARSVEGKGPVRIVVGGSDQIYRDLSPAAVDRLPRHRDELLLPTHGTGCLTSQAALKRWNRRNELLADAAERAAVAADSLGALPYPASEIEQAWTRFLWHQMHDDLTGTSIPAAYRFTDNDLLLALNQFGSILTDSVGAVASQMDTRTTGRPLVVFNPLSIARQDVVTLELPEDLQPPATVSVVDPEGEEVPAQEVTLRENGKPGLVFLAEVPPLGFQIYDLRRGDIPSREVAHLEVSRRSLANRRYRIEIDDRGDVASVFDRLTGRELLAAPICWQLLRDRSARWPAWEILYDDLLVGDPQCVGGRPEVEILEHGPVRVALSIVRRSHRSTFRQILRLSAGDPGDRFEVESVVDWHTRGRLLKARFALSSPNPLAHYDLGLGLIRRGNNRREKYEVPAQQWAALASVDGKGGASILNDCKYGWDKPDDSTLRLSLLRSPRVIRKFRHQGWQDHGRHRFSYALFGHQEQWQPADSSWQAARLNQPLLAFHTTPHPGQLGKRHSLVDVSTPQVAIQSLKRAEDSRRWVIRLRELSGHSATRVEVRPTGGLSSAHEVNGMEDEVGPAKLLDDRLQTALQPFGIKTFALEAPARAATIEPPECRPLALPYNLKATRRRGHADRRGFDGEGRSIPAELWPDRLRSGGLDFRLAAAEGAHANAVSCRGQRLELEARPGDRLHLLAAATRGPTSARFELGSRETAILIGPYTGFLGGRPRPRRWLPRTFGRGELVLGDEHSVAWVGTHRRGPDGSDQPYVFCYLYRYALELPTECRQITLPRTPEIILFAATLADDALFRATPALPLYD